ncbi:AGE family epimerase/isomerase [uncultured Flavobacterium sp.]|uniref:AGE family epimerase/isomerase n=1 Tax=uncultured Flavobacterium sp. TaxID=165435 RepID=UPI0025E8E2BB|nr:AGE family epimerase/isomerase [uncultured Flavobacterium sp.]
MSKIKTLHTEISNELTSILKYWSENAIDEKNGGFIGQIDFEENKHEDAEKGAVLHARILWTFVAAFKKTNDQKHFAIAEKAFDYIKNNFYDKKQGGIFWSLHSDGTPKDTKNQVYAIAFVIYGLAEFYAVSQNEEALELAKSLYQKIEEHSFDKENKGYFEAFNQDWTPIEDLRLSEKDANEKKTMNTHLHIVEAYANLYKVSKNEALKNTITQLLETIETHFINPENWHLKLFFDENWIEKPDVISYGHDIEAAWLLLWCAEVIEDKKLIQNYKKYAVEMARVTKEGLDQDGGLWYEFDPEKNKMIAEKHWWPQAELWIGMVNAWQISGDETYFKIFENNWNFVKKHILDTKNGEWIWGINADYSKIEKDKAGFWKCPYHNSRACLEVIDRLSSHL